MERMIAYCGLVCTDCPAYIATQTDNRTLLESTAKQWSEQFHVTIPPDSILCDGCLAQSDRLCAHCYECNIRACGIQHQVANCAVCPDYGCEQIQGFLAQAPEAKKVLEQIRAGL